MPGTVYDTSVFIAYQPQEFPANFLVSAVVIQGGYERSIPHGARPANFLVSAVVIQELAAGATDKSILQRLNALRLLHEKAATLLVPNSKDWWEAGRVL